jgi:hypothetical protein
MNKIVDVLREMGLKTKFIPEEKDLLDTYMDIVVSGKYSSFVNEMIVHHLLGTVEGLKISDLTKFIPNWEAVHPRMRDKATDLLQEYSIYFDKNDMCFFVSANLWNMNKWEVIINANVDAIHYLLEMFLPAEFTRYIFSTKEQQKNEIEFLLGAVVYEMVVKSGVLKKLLKVIPEEVMRYGEIRHQII